MKFPQNFFAALLFIVSTSLFSQTEVSGLITDSLGNPIPFAPVGLISLPDSSVIKGTVSDESGKYSIDFSNYGKFIIRVTVIEYNEKTSSEFSVDSLSPKKLIFDMELKPSISTLGTVTVTAIKRVIEFKNGNTIVNVENSPLAKGNTVYELLSKLPGVSVTDNSIQFNGRSGVIIMINGRIQQLSDVQLLNLLKSMNAESVEKIELMKNPPVKYEASGTAGMINIKTKKVKLKGYSGSIYASGSQGAYGRSSAGAALNYKSDKIAIFSSVNSNYGINEARYANNLQFTTDSSVTEFAFRNNLLDVDKGINYSLGADWFVNDNNIIGFKVDGGPAAYISNGEGVNSVYKNNDLGYDHLNVKTSTPDKWNINNFNVNAEHHFDTLGSNLVFTSDFTSLSENLSSGIQNLFLDKNNQQALLPNVLKSNNLNATNILASKLDFVKAFNSETSFEMGAKASFVNTTNDYLFEKMDNFSGNYITDTALTNNYSYREQTYAAYLNFVKSFKKVNFQIGVRGEYTDLQGSNVSKGFEIRKSYFKMFPNINLEFTPSEKNSFQLNLNRRTDRPAYDNLMPFQFYQSQYVYLEGNPYLLPEYSYNVELSHTFKESITNSLTYTHVDDVILDYTKQNDSTKVSVQTVKNMDYHNYYSYSLLLQHTFRPWWEISGDLMIAYMEYVGSVEGKAFKTASFCYAPSMTNTFTGPKNTKLEIIAFYNSPKAGGFMKVESRWMLSFAIKKSFFNDKIDCSFGMNDIFYSYVLRTNLDFYNQSWNFKATNDTRRVVLSINYNFGKTKSEERDLHSNEDEKDRLKH